MPEVAPESVQSRFDRLDSKRHQVLHRARESAALTLPALLPPEGHDESQPLPTPHQGLGARGVNNLASKMLIALLPPNEPFFKFEPDPDVISEMLEADKNARAEVQRRLSRIEQTVLTGIEGSGDRANVFELLRHLITVGNVMVHMPAEGGMRLFRLDQYVCRRDRMGNVLEAIAKEVVDPVVLDDETIDATGVDLSGDGNKEVPLYTVITRRKDDWRVVQVINDVEVPDSEATYPIDKPAHLVLRWTAAPGEDYGRGLVEEHLGDLRPLEGMSKSLLNFAGVAGKMVFLTNPNGVTDVKVLNKAQSGDFVPGREQDITTLGLEKTPDFQIVKRVMDDISQRLHQAFLLNASIQRDAERVTATEIQMMARELEDALGGVYSVLSQEFQLPYIRRRVIQLEKQGKIPELPEDVVNLRITTGLDALGRGHDLQKLTSWIEAVTQLPPEVVKSRVNWTVYLERLSAAMGIDTQDLLKGEEGAKQEENQAQAQNTAQGIAEKAGPEVVQQAIQSGAIPNPGTSGASAPGEQ